MKKLIIGCLNSKYVHMSSAPWCLAAGIDAFCKQKPDYDIFEGTINGDLDAYCSKIIAKKPDTVSFCTYIWNVTETLYVCKKLKENIDCDVILGGPEVAYRRRDVLQKYPFVDYALAGEGEFALPEFLDAYDKCSVAGLCYRKNGEIVENPEKCYSATPPSPYTDRYFAALSGRICYIESSRGCPFRCAFCLSGRVSGLRFFDLEQVKRDLIRLANSGTRTIKFVDRTFNANERHANEILEFILQSYGNAIPNGVCFHFEIAGDILRDSTLEILKHMPKGAVQLEIGMQSFNEDTLLAINRKTDTVKLIKNIKTLLGFGNMHIHIDLIAGLTGEDINSFENSFNIGFDLRAHMLQMGFLKLLYGADMREDKDKYPCKFNDTPPYEVISTPWLSRDDVIALKKTEDALDRMYNSGRFLFTIDYLLNQTKLTPFALFYTIGNAIDGTGKSLGDYAVMIFEYFKERVDSELLREKLVCDLLCCASALQIPEVLKLNDPLHKKVKAAFPKTTKVAILRKSNQIFAADHASQRDFFGRFKGEFHGMEIIKDKE